MKFSPRIMVVSVKWWGGSCPFQLHGRTDDNRPLYLRARHDELRVELGPVGGEERDAVMGDTVFLVTHPDDEHEWGHIELDRVVQLTRGFIRWPWSLRLRALLWPLGRRYRAWRFLHNLRRLNRS